MIPGTYGLVVCGGQSNRMDTDKSMLQYHDKPQRYHVYDMLLPFCERIFISCNKDQASSIEAGYDCIVDDESFGNIGPMRALLTAFNQYPKKNFLLIGCDYPFLTMDELQLFSNNCTNEPSAFYNKADDIYEPMLAWYPHKGFNELKRKYETKQFSLQLFLKESNAIKYLPTDINCIQSIDTPEAFDAAFKLINAG
jgi:molybdopterin-guanine dinucleotide biosynthesis protein A